MSAAQHTPGPVAYEIWIKNDPARIDGFVGDTQCMIRSRDGAWTPMTRTTDLCLAEWNLRDLVKCNPGIASHYEIREVAKATETAYQGVRCQCIVTGCRPGPGCPVYSKTHCEEHIAFVRCDKATGSAA